MELQLDRKIANKRIFLRLINFIKYKTRRFIIRSANFARMWIMKIPFRHESVEAMSFINDRFKQKNNQEFLISMND
jgi:transcription termination factor Rho